MNPISFGDEFLTETETAASGAGLRASIRIWQIPDPRPRVSISID